MAVSRERLNQLYTELFGRAAEDKGAEYWMGTGITGEDLRKNLIYAASKAEEGKRQDYESYLARQAQLARGTTPVGYGPSSNQETLAAMQEEITGLRALLEQMQSGGSYAPVGGTPIGQPGQGAPAPVTPSPVTDPSGTYSSGSMMQTAPEQTNPYLSPVSQAPIAGYVPPTPEMLDAYRFQQYYNQGAVSPVDQGVGSLSYFGIPPSQIQSVLSGF
jgi:hypothetical protein